MLQLCNNQAAAGVRGMQADNKSRAWPDIVRNMQVNSRQKRREPRRAKNKSVFFSRNQILVGCIAGATLFLHFRQSR